MTIKTEYKFGNLSEEGYRHFPIIYLAYGSNGFCLCILGLIVTVKLWKEKSVVSNGITSTE
jgi:hypothetical protein